MFKLGAYSVSLRQLQYVVAVAEHKNFRAAASHCFVSQPSLSAQVAEVESALDVQLFERDPRGVIVTDAGHEIVRRARRILTEVEELTQDARRFSDPSTMSLRLGVIPTIAPYLLPDLGAELLERFPKLHATWVEEKTDVLVQKVERGEIDLALFAEEADTGTLEIHPVVEDEFVLLAAKDSSLGSDTTPIDVDALRGETLLMLNEGHCFRDQAIDLCHQVGADYGKLQATSLTTLVQMAATAHGATLAPRLSVGVENRRAHVVARPFNRPAPSRTIALGRRRRSPLERLIEELTPAIEEAYRLAVER